MALPLNPSTRLSEHRDAYVELTCRRCGHTRDLRAEELARLMGWDTVLSRCLERFRCSRCEARQVEIRFGYDRKPRGWLKHF